MFVRRMPARTRRATGIAGVVAVAAVLAGCGGDSSADDDAVGAAANEPAAEQATDGDGGTDSGTDGGAGSSDYLDDLYADSLHDAVTPAAAGTAYIEIGGERFEFTTVDCSVHDTPGAAYVRITASDDAEGAGHKLYFDRTVGPDMGWSFEDEKVQLALMTTLPGENETGAVSNSMAQSQRDLDSDIEWLSGSADDSPMIRAVGSEVTASGVLQRVPGAPEPLEGDFVAAGTCS